MPDQFAASAVCDVAISFIYTAAGMDNTDAELPFWKEEMGLWWRYPMLVCKGGHAPPGGQGQGGTAVLTQGWVLQAATFAAAAQRQPWKFPGTPGPEPAPAWGKEDAASQSIKSPEWEEGARDAQSQ